MAQQFFVLTLGKLEGGEGLGLRIFNAMLAVSSLGNIIVMVCARGVAVLTPSMLISGHADIHCCSSQARNRQGRHSPLSKVLLQKYGH